MKFTVHLEAIGAHIDGVLCAAGGLILNCSAHDGASVHQMVPM